ncbi:MAG: glycosyltransferase family 39 protein [Dehalococcoidia bacterium]|nr:glycosyltransferase family 39 protein [Dehalococcoidia bacterium]
MVFILALVGFLLRVWNVGSVPSAPAGDESSIALEVMRILDEGWIGIWNGAALGNPSGHMYLIAPFFWIGGTTLAMIRLSSVLLGTAMIPLCYLIVRIIFPFRVALLAAITVTFFYWFLVQSRIAVAIPFSVFMAAASVCLLMYPVRSQRHWVAIAAGLALGLGLYSHKGYVIYFIAVWGASLLVLPFAYRLHRHQPIVLALLVSLVAGGALLMFYATSGYLTDNLGSQYKVSQSDLLSIGSHLSRLVEIVLFVHFPFQARGYHFDGIAPSSLVPPVFAVFFWLGLLTTLLFINRRSYQLLLLGWLIGIAPALLVPGGETRRYLFGVFFALLILVIGYMVAVHLLTRWVLPRLGYSFPPNDLTARRVQYGIAAVAIGVFAVGFSAINLNQYSQWTNTPEVRFQFPPDLAKAAEFIDALDPEYSVRFYSERWAFDNETIQWLAPDRAGENGSAKFGGDGTIFSGGVVTAPTAFMLFDRYVSLISDLKSVYPDGAEYHIMDDESGGNLQFIAYVIDDPPSRVDLPKYYRLTPSPEQAEFRVDVPLSFQFDTNGSASVRLVVNSETGGTANLAHQDDQCPAPANSEVLLAPGDFVIIRACEPGPGYIQLYTQGNDAPVREYRVMTSPESTADLLPADSDYGIAPDPADIDIRALPSEHHALQLITNRSALIIPSPDKAVVIHNNPDLLGRDGCKEVGRTPEGDTRLLIILPKEGEKIVSPFYVVGCAPGPAALEIESSNSIRRTYLFNVSEP